MFNAYNRSLQTRPAAMTRSRPEDPVMSLPIAIDALYDSGWSTLDSTGCSTAPDGRVYPGEARLRREFASLGFDLVLRQIEEFGCFRAEWRSASGTVEGAVVGQSEAEAGVYALAKLRRSLAAVMP